jgi:hypothetical protein
MDEQSLLVEEYKVTQSVINHYERLIWSIGSILNASVMIFAGLSIRQNGGRGFWVVVLLSAFVSFVWYKFVCRYRNINMNKFRRLWEIEETLVFKQNLSVKQHDNAHACLRGHALIIIICIGIPVSLLFYWLMFCMGD